MLLEAQKKKIEDFQSMRSGELKEVEKLKQEKATLRSEIELDLEKRMAQQLREQTQALQSKAQAAQTLVAGDAFVIPPDMACLYSAPSEDLELLEVSLPGDFETHLEDSV